MNFLLLLLIIEILLFCFAFYLSEMDIMAPSVIICVMFIISTLFAFLNIENWQIQFSYKTCFIISSGIFIFIAAEAVYRYLFCGQLSGAKPAANKSFVHSYDIPSWKLNLLIIYDVIICAWFCLAIIRVVGGSYSISGLFAAYRRLQIQSLSDSGEVSVGGAVRQFLKIVNASGYVSSYLLAHALVCNQKKKVLFKYIFIIILSLLPTVMSAGRSGFLKIIFAFLIEYYIIWHQKKGWDRNLSKKYFKYGIILLVCGIPLFYFSLEWLGRSTKYDMLQYVSQYIGAPIQLFNLYLSDPVPRTSFGEESLVGLVKVFSAIGLCQPSKSSNTEFRVLMGKQMSNIYTFFRRPYHDFGLIGMYLFTAMVSSFFAWLYFKRIKNKQIKAATPFVLIYGYFFYWIAISSLDQYSYNMISLGAVMNIAAIIITYWLLTDPRINFKVRP